MRALARIQQPWRAFSVAMSCIVMMVTTSPGAHAATDYTPTGGPALNLVGTNITILDVPAAQTFSCAQFTIAGQLMSPAVTRPIGQPAVDLGNLNYSGCTNPIFGPATLAPDTGWILRVVGTASGTTWPVRLVGIDIKLIVPNCSLRFAGAMDGTFNTATQRLTPTASTMVLTQVLGSMCVTLDFQVDDLMEIQGYFTNVPSAGSGPLTLS